MRSVLIFILASIALASGLNNTNIESIFAKYIVGYKAFSNKLYKELSKSIRGNLIVCPLSAQYALLMTLAGAKGSTESELRAAMNYNLNSKESKKMWVFISKCFKNGSDNYRVLSANGVFVDNNFHIRESYKGIIENNYRSKCETMDFENIGQTVQLINNWVKERTRHIDKFLEPSQLNPATRLLLVNVISLTAKWETPFKIKDTIPGDFRVSLTKNRTVHYMRGSRKTLYGYDETLGAKFLELPFQSANKSLVVVLPDEKDGMAKLEANLEQVLAYNELEEEYVDISLPKFNFDILLHTKPALQKLGVKNVFDRNLADLSGISAQKGLFVDSIIQKAFINVNEAGIQAGAATAVLVSTKQLPIPGDVTFNADHPFLFYVKVYRGNALFIGRVVSPDEVRAETALDIEDNLNEESDKEEEEE